MRPQIRPAERIRRGVLAVAQLSQQAQAVAAWEHNVEHDGIKWSRTRSGPGLVAVVADTRQGQGAMAGVDRAQVCA